jgi:hypothetical protein
MLPRGSHSFPRYFQSSFRRKRSAADPLRKTAASAERNLQIRRTRLNGIPLQVIAHEQGLSVQRVH